MTSSTTLVIVVVGFMVCIIVAVVVVVLVVKNNRERALTPEEAAAGGGKGTRSLADGMPAAPAGPAPPSDAIVGRKLSDFYSVDDSEVYPKKAPGSSEIVNITDVGNGTFQFLLRHRGSWYDGDRDGVNNAAGKAKSRAEVVAPGKSHQVEGETWEYGTTFCAAKDFIPSRGFCNIFQLFPVAWIQLKGLTGDTISGGLYYTGSDNDFVAAGPVRSFTFKRGEWVSFVLRAKVHQSSGELMLSINGDAYQGKRGFRLFSKKRKDFGSKWGLYTSTASVTSQPLNDSKVWHRNIWMRKAAGK